MRILENAEAGHLCTVKNLPLSLKIPNHPFVTIRLSDGRMKHLPDGVIITGASRVFLEVHNKYDGPPITLDAEVHSA